MTFTSYDLAGPDPNPMTKEEVGTLKALVMMLGPAPIIINIGAERGTSTLAMLEEQPDALIFSIDVAPCEGEMENLLKAGLERQRVFRILGNSAKIGLFWPYHVHMVHVDGNHSYEGVKADIEAWRSRIILGGMFSFHDYFEGEPPVHNPSGAGQAIRELIEPDPSWREILFVQRLKAFVHEPHVEIDGGGAEMIPILTGPKKPVTPNPPSGG